MGTAKMARIISCLDRRGGFSGMLSHEFLMFENDADHMDSWIFESMIGKGVRFSPFINLLEAIDAGRVKYAIVDEEKMDSSEAGALFNICRRHDKKPYDTISLVWLALWLKFRNGKPPWFSGKNNNRYWCSEAVWQSLVELGKSPPKLVEAITPHRSFYHRFELSVHQVLGPYPETGRIYTPKDFRYPQPVT